MSLAETLELAIRHHQAGRRAEAEALYRQILSIEPGHAETMQRLGLLAHQSGRGREAVELLRRSVELRPDAADFRSNLAGVLAALGRFDEAVAELERAVQLRPDLASAWNNLGNIHRRTGNLGAAEAAFRRAVSARADYVEAMNSLGDTLQARGQAAEAVEFHRRAVQLRPDFAHAWNSLGNALQSLERLDEAARAYRRATEIEPRLAEAHVNLGTVLERRGRADEALAACRRGVELRPDFPEAWLNLGNALQLQGRAREAVAAYQRATALRPDFAQAWFNLGAALRNTEDLDAAVDAYRRAVAIRPDYGEAWGNLANTLRDQGELDESIACFRRAAELTGLAWVDGNLLYTLHFHSDYDARRIRQEHDRWHARHALPLENSIRPHDNDRRPDRRLRVGYVSCDFRQHPVGRFILPLLEQHDHRAFEIFCYSDTTRTDAMTERHRACADAWRDTVGTGDSRFAELVREDRIDILVDLAMHARTGRMLAFARKPAPVQVSYLAYCSTSGLRTMDYRLTDPMLDPPGTEDDLYFEKSIRLPRTYWCYPAPDSAPEVGPLPAETAGHVTFGCLNTYAKVTAETWDAWARLLQRIPSARLQVHAMHGRHRQKARDFLAGRGIDPDRLTFIEFLPLPEYFRQYCSIDIALDPFPYAGGTTTCDALWMGVPVVSMTGHTAVSRGGLSILTNVGHADWVARDADEYLRIAEQLAGDLSKLERIRAALRDELRASPVMDAPRFARDVEAAYRAVWHNWTRSTEGSAANQAGPDGFRNS